MKILVIFQLLWLTAMPSFGQTSDCETVYNTVDILPSYEGGMQALMKYFEKELMPIISKTENKTLTTKLNIMLTIDANGIVTDATLSKHNLTKNCEDELRIKILTMSGWIPGRLNSQNVCCKHGWVISCIKWAE
jgi:hypothetical protein